MPAAEPSDALVVVLHGLGDSMEGFFWLPGTLGLPGVNYLLVNAPNPYVIGYAWYDIENPAPGVLQGRELIGKLFDELERQGWESRNVLLFGFSQGCVMSIDFALRHPEPLAGIVGISGYALLDEYTESEIQPQAREQAWLITHGHHDPLLPLYRTRNMMDQLRQWGIPIEWHDYPKEHTIDMEEELPLLRNWIGGRFGSQQG
ncbi:MAG: serine esterase [SAR324 cluster bacterium]|nr:serine esterase [SAR324 cluster bacterium]